MANITTKIPVKSMEKKNEAIFFIDTCFVVFILAKKAIEK
jgi:nitrate reductase NapE component